MEATPIHIMTGQPPDSAIEEIIEFPTQTRDTDKKELVCTVAENYKIEIAETREKLNEQTSF